MIDTHAHINTEPFNEDIDLVIQRAIDNGVEKIIIPAIEPKDFNDLIQLINKYEILNCGIGIHPHNVKDINQEDLNLVNELSYNNKVVAIGEIGLDYYYDFVPKPKQIDSFERQIEISIERKLPIIVHNRESDEDMYDILAKYKNISLTGVLHCFSSNLDFLKKILDLGFNVSFTGNITFKKVDLYDVIRYVPNDRFMIETDSPYMAPVPMRGKRNEPSFVKYVANKIAEIKEMKIEEVINYSTENAKKLFNLSLVLICLFLSLNNDLYSQDDVYYEDDTYIEDENNDRVFDKLIGIGGMFGTTTIVETRYIDEGTQSISYEGFLGFGAELSYSIFDKLQLRLNYVRAVNSKVQDEARRNGINPGNPFYPDPNIHQMYEITTNYIPNPNNKINFMFTFGGNLFINSINKQVDQKFGLTFGLGVTGNIWNSDYGLLSVTGEFRVNTEIGTDNYDNVLISKDDIRSNVDINNLYSMPRLTIQFYPKFR